jgi:WD40 repeat protein
LGALGRRADEIYTRLDLAGQEAARQLFLRLITLGEGTEDTRRRVLRTKLEELRVTNYQLPITNYELRTAPSPLAAVVDRFGAARLLTFDRDPLTRAPTVEVAHEALLREWPRLRDWLAASRDDVRWQRMLAAATAEWQQAGQDESYLLRGSRLDQFESWSEQSQVALSGEERAFLEASLAARQQRLAAEEARRQRELETAQKLAQTERQRAEEQARAAQGLRQRAAFLAGALAVAALLAILAFTFARSASHNAELAAAREVDALTNAELAATRAAEAFGSAGLAATREVEAINSAGVAAARQAEAEAEANLRATAEAIAIEERETAEQQRTIAEQHQAFAEEQARLATSRELALTALNTLDRDPELSILLALQAIETAYTQAAEDALHRAVQRSRLRQVFPGVRRAVYHPDGNHVATISETELQVWDLATNQPMLNVILPAEPTDIAYSPDGRTIATGHEDGSLILWDAVSGVEQHRSAGQEALLECLAFSLDGRTIATGHQDGSLILWDAVSGAAQGRLEGHTAWVYHVAFSPDGRRLASSGREGIAILWDLDSGDALFTFPSVVLWTHRIAFSPDGTMLAVPERAENDAARGVNLWDTTSGALRLTVPSGIGVFGFSPDGTYLATGGAGDRASIWDVPASLAVGTGREVATLSGHTNVIHTGAFSPDGVYFVTASHDGTARLWNPHTGPEYFTLAGHSGIVSMAAFSADGRRLLTGARDGARIWDVSVPGNEEVMVLAGPGGAGRTSIALSPDGRILALGSISGITHLHDAASGELLAILSGHSKGILRLAFSPDSRRLATAGEDGLVSVWDVDGSLATGQGQALLTLNAHDPGAVIGGAFSGVVGLDFSPDGSRLVTSGADGLIRLWDSATGELSAEVEDYPGTAGVWSVVFSPHGRYLAGSFEIRSDDGLEFVVQVWRLSGDNLEELYTITDVPHRIHNLRFSPDSRLLLTSGFLGYLALWDLTSGELARSFSGHPASVPRSVFSPDGTKVASTSADGSIRLWDVAGGNNLLILAPETIPWDVAFSPDGAYLYTGSWDGGVSRVYAVQLEALISLARSRLTRSLTDEECRQYLHLEACPAGQ